MPAPPRRITLSLTVAGNAGTAHFIDVGEIQRISIDAPSGASYELELLDADGDGIWGQGNLTGDRTLRLDDELVNGQVTVNLANATNGAYRIKIWLRSGY